MIKMVNERVLIIDDDPMILRVIQSVLRGKDFIVDIAHDGERAIHKVRTQDFKIVLLDISLPDMNGLDLLKEIKTIKPNTSVIIMSGYMSQITFNKAMSLGASFYLTKPFEPGALFAAIKEVL
jgi:DNA-binding response OmpR family regulator